jgi:hypothetical protein
LFTGGSSAEQSRGIYSSSEDNNNSSNMGVVTTPVAPDEREAGAPNDTAANGDGYPPLSTPHAATYNTNDNDGGDESMHGGGGGTTNGNGRTSRFNSLMSNASNTSGMSSVGSVTPTTSQSDSSSDVSGLFRGAPGLGAADPSASPSRAARRSRRATMALNKQGSYKGSKKRQVFVEKPREMPPGRLAFVSEIFRIKGTIVLKVVPQIVLAALMGLFANVVKLVYCGNDVASNEVGGLFFFLCAVSPTIFSRRSEDD